MSIGSETGGARPGLVLSALGPDRPGLVKEISSFVMRHGGNIEDTRMSKLGGEFALLMLVTGSEAALSGLEKDLVGLEASAGVQCFSKSTQTATDDDTRRLYHLEASGLDHPGIVERVTAVLAEQGVNVTSFSSRVENAPLTGTLVFLFDAELQLPPEGDVLSLEKKLSELCDKEQLEFILNQL